jgi:ketosteroid isomerase-like protein
MARHELTDLARGYLEALDRLDVDATLDFFADDAVFTIQSSRQELTGKEAIGTLWREVLGAHSAMRHRITNVVVDERERKVATELSFQGVLAAGDVEERNSIYVFEVGEHGRFSRVIVWIDGPTPAQP